MNDCPLFEHGTDAARNPMSRPSFKDQFPSFPQRCLMSFMGDVLQQFVDAHRCDQIAVHHSEARNYPIWRYRAQSRDIALVQAPVGAPAAGILMDLLVASGAKAIVSCGGCGVLSPISSGLMLTVDSAVRDEGTSYHYLAPARQIRLDEAMVALEEEVLLAKGLPFKRVKTWTTDGFFRETPQIVARRREEGCATVDMECSALAAIAQFYGIRYGALFYSGDSLARPEGHDHRDWISNISARYAVLDASIESLVRCIFL